MNLRDLKFKPVHADLHECNEVGGGEGESDWRVTRRCARLHHNPITGRLEALVPDCPHPSHRAKPCLLFSPNEFAPAYKHARTLYDAYNLQSGGVNFRGEPCPEFDDLPQAIKDNWLFTASIAWHLFAPKEN